jgi:protein O-mannosyl-transferase
MDNQEINTASASAGPVNAGFRYFPFFNKKQPVFVLVLVGVIFYCTSLYNEYALDDGIIIHQNSYVLKGVAGIKDILTKDAYDSFYRRMHASDQLQGGRYRPLSIVSFALEQEVIGTYRTGYYMYLQDINQNGVLDNEPQKLPPNSPVTKSKVNGIPISNVEPMLSNYEYNAYVDLNKDGVAQAEECHNCWDTNKNFKNDASEDLNADGVFNEVDCQVKGAFLRHFNSVWLYILGCVLLYLVFRRYLFKEQQDLAFLAALIFLTHPVHAEVVANVKGRDDVFSLIFIALTLLFGFKFLESKKISALIISTILFFLALLSKEFAIMLLLLIPLAVHAFHKTSLNIKHLAILGLSFLGIAFLMIGLKLNFPNSIPSFVLTVGGTILFVGLCALAFRKAFLNKDLTTLMISFFTMVLLYIGCRISVVSIAPGIPDTELLNNPYLLATGQEIFATKIFVFLKYLVLSIFPMYLTSDYSYASIPYQHFNNLGFLISLLLNVGLLILGTVLQVKRHVLGFSILTYYAFLFLISNFIFNVGAIMDEGFLFHATIGVAIAFAWLLLTGFEKIDKLSFSERRTILLSFLSIVLFLYGCKTWERNWDWKNDVTLFLKDVKTSPNSVLVLGNAGARWIDLADTKEITGVALPGEDSTVFNDYNGTLHITDEEMREGGYSNKREAALKKGIGYLKHAVELHPRYVNGFLNLGLASFKLGNDKEAIFYWKQAERLYPKNPYLENYYAVYSSILKERGMKAFDQGKMKEAAIAYNFWTLIDVNNAEAWHNLGRVYFKLSKFIKAKQYWNRALKLNPNYEEVKKAMDLMPEIVE